MTDICCIGHITRDRIITQIPPVTTHCAGGSAYYMAWAIQALPHDVNFHLITSVSREVMPEVEKLRQAGVRVTAFESNTNVFFENKYGANMDNRTQRVLAKSAPFTLNELKDEQARVFHLGSLLADDFPMEVVSALHERGLVSIDVQGYLREVRGESVHACQWKEKEQVLAMTDILKLNEYEMQVITDSSDPRTVATKLAQMGVREVVLTFGDYGSLICADGQFYEIPAYKPQHLVDATGCGDTYSAGYLYCRAQGESPLESGKFAAAMCTLKLEQHGPFSRSIDEIRYIMTR